ncbi:maleylpyruvate isomerase family mycothiol-dependent enzyme [Actinomadura sp. DC4]|uniref:maleylpyruvate isomerase family mycothiol-dependent enzyme n=1 Tax=Actinomadura sp. DC4 TaxID=3055069 RepID=UPI0025AFAAFE|nr:maleylpyruvate isomerase family mycothiol-dependent enzyme [Actinomadura sp. DC4]MDN3351969.1 maleylpyruvate isomerase family mycothiol-dependent enzyme [Actinomadura sp. DC4]
MTIFDDLVAEQDRLEEILGLLSPAQWESPSGADGWTVADVVLHLAQSEEGVVTSVNGAGHDLRPGPDDSVDAAMARLVREERTSPSEVFGRWREARRAAVTALRGADPGRSLLWVEAPLKPATLATTRLAEHWAHGLDVTVPLGIDLPDTDRLRHIAWLAHRTLPYALALTGGQAQEVRCELTAPNGRDMWRYGPDDAESAITGPAGAFCRVAAQRLSPGESGLRTTGPHADAALKVLRTYAA